MLRASPLKSAAESMIDLVDARLFRVDLRLARVLLEPAAVRRAAGEVDDLDLRAQRERLRGVVAGVVRDQRDDVRIEARLGQHFARDPHGDRERQDRVRMRLDDHRIAGREAREDARDSRSTSGTCCSR